MTSKELQDSSVISLASTQCLLNEIMHRAVRKATTEAVAGFGVEFLAITISSSEKREEMDEIQLMSKDGQIFTYPIDRF